MNLVSDVKPNPTQDYGPNDTAQALYEPLLTLRNGKSTCIDVTRRTDGVACSQGNLRSIHFGRRIERDSKSQKFPFSAMVTLPFKIYYNKAISIYSVIL